MITALFNIKLIVNILGSADISFYSEFELLSYDYCIVPDQVNSKYFYYLRIFLAMGMYSSVKINWPFTLYHLYITLLPNQYEIMSNFLLTGLFTESRNASLKKGKKKKKRKEKPASRSLTVRMRCVVFSERLFCLRFGRAGNSL